MSNAAWMKALAALSAALTLGACAPPARDRVDKDRLNADIDQTIGGLGTCVIILDTQSGRKVYQYGRYDICAGGLPPCETFEPVAALIGLDAGLITPETVVKWDGSPQPSRAWQVDANLAQAFQTANGWWFGRLSKQIGRDRYVERLKALGYGSHDPAGPIDKFWMGPAQGGGMGVAPADAAAFARRMFAGKLPVKPASLSAVVAAMASETRGPATMTAIAGSCADRADNARGVGWWVGRLKSPTRDLSFAASVESATPPPGGEVGVNVKDVFAEAGLWPKAD